jgi:hypothetical protein
MSRNLAALDSFFVGLSAAAHRRFDEALLRMQVIF